MEYRIGKIIFGIFTHLAVMVLTLIVSALGLNRIVEGGITSLQEATPDWMLPLILAALPIHFTISLIIVALKWLMLRWLEKRDPSRICKRLLPTLKRINRVYEVKGVTGLGFEFLPPVERLQVLLMGKYLLREMKKEWCVEPPRPEIHHIFFATVEHYIEECDINTVREIADDIRKAQWEEKEED